MRRRTYLVAATGLLGGCLSSSNETDSVDTRRPGEEPTTATTSKPNNSQLQYGDWYEYHGLGLSVESVQVKTEVEVTEAEGSLQVGTPEEEYPTREDEAFVVADVVLKGVGEYGGAAAASDFYVVIRGERYQSSSCIHEIDDSRTCIGSSDIVGSEGRERLTVESVDHGETAEYWIAALVPRGVSEDNLVVEYDGSETIRWR